MEQMYLWFETFLNKLPPLLQLILGMLMALGFFKLLVVMADRIKQDGGKDEK